MAKGRNDQLTANEALNVARPRDEIRTVELMLVPGQIRIRVAEHQRLGTTVFSQQHYHPATEQWVGSSRWARDFDSLYTVVLNLEERDFLDARGWKPVYFSYERS